ncbi:nitroreductase family protein [Bacillus sp. MRMR6]|uniref:nitroreductase family protein n=1 Tax=Bacillus sp. MRMR6 TaxID=1928617 RepID=UPI000B27EADF|nr:nitroreductase family protein [Bacillus sp. MRMR6]
MSIETMRKRQSIRTYDPHHISKSDLDKIKTYINEKSNFIGPLGGSGKIELVQLTGNVTDKGIKLGTYGFIKNPRAYLVGISENQKYSLVDFAYTFQKLILLLTEMGLGTCWMGGTFNRHSFEKEISLSGGEFIPCITPIGYPADKQRIFDKALRKVVKADNRKSWDQLFYNGTFDTALTKEQAGRVELPLEMVRLGPSASNKQPWRMVLSEDRAHCHLYIEHTPNYSSKLGYDMQLLDIGIAMCQFELACEELYISGTWVVEDPEIMTSNAQMEYLVTWKIDN